MYLYCTLYVYSCILSCLVLSCVLLVLSAKRYLLQSRNLGPAKPPERPADLAWRQPHRAEIRYCWQGWGVIAMNLLF